MAQQLKSKIDIDLKLNSQNYTYWKFKITPLLEDEDLIEVKDNAPGGLTLKDSPKAKRAILTNVSDEIGLALMAFQNAPEMWNYLYNEFSGVTQFRKIAGIKNLVKFTYNKNTLKENLQVLNRTLQDANRFITIYILKSKGDAAEAFKDFDRKFHNMHQRHITLLHSDGALEYFPKAVDSYCRTYGISQDSSSPYTPEQNGRAERANRTVLEGISALLFDSNLSWEYWGYAAQTFVYLKNRSPHQKLPRSTPYTEWFQKLPNLSHIRVFGTKLLESTRIVKHRLSLKPMSLAYGLKPGS